MEKLQKGYFGIQRLNGYSHTLEDGPIKTLVRTVDLWIEDNTDLLKEIRVSQSFYDRLARAVGYSVTTLDTIIGDAPLNISPALSRDEIEIIKSESQPILTPKGSPDFSETSYIRDEVKNTCEKITCPVIEAASDLTVLKRGAQ